MAGRHTCFTLKSLLILLLPVVVRTFVGYNVFSKRTSLGVKSKFWHRHHLVLFKPEGFRMTGVETSSSVLVVGGGPVGLAAAVALKGFDSSLDITVIEKGRTGSANPSAWFPYAIDATTQDIAQELGFGKAFQSVGFRTAVSNVSLITTHGIQPMEMPGFDMKLRNKFRRMRRVDLVNGLRDICETEGVKIHECCSLVNLEFSESEEQPGILATLAKHFDDGRTECESMEPSLLIGADGKHSEVRKQLEKWSHKHGLSARSKQRFNVQSCHAFSANLKVKTLPVSPTQMQRLQPTYLTYLLQSKERRDANRRFDGGLWRMAEGLPSPLVFMTTQEHAIWNDPQLQTVDGFRAYLAEQHPVLYSAVDFSDQQLKTFIAASGTTFPHPTWVNAAGLHVQGTRQGGGHAGVVLAGDALHCMPPDLAKGVNSGIRDVEALVEALAAARGDGALKEGERGGDALGSSGWLQQAVALYEEKVVPEAEAICRITAADSFWFIGKAGPASALAWMTRFLLQLNFALRLKLAALPWVGGTIFHPPAKTLLVSLDSFSTAWRRAQQTTAVLCCLAAVFAVVAASGVAAASSWRLA